MRPFLERPAGQALDVDDRRAVPFEGVEVTALDGAGKSLGKAVRVKTVEDGCRISVGKPATPWYLVRIDR